MKYESLEYCKDGLGEMQEGGGGGSGREIRRKRNGRERERKNEGTDNKRLTSRLSEWWNFKTLKIKLFIPVYKGGGREEKSRRSGKRGLVKGNRSEK